MTTELRTIADQLVAARDALRQRMNGTADPSDSDALFLQVLEINHRLTMLDQLEFAQGTADLSSNIAEIVAATAQVKAAIARLDGIRDAVAAVKGLLQIADSVIDILT